MLISIYMQKKHLICITLFMIINIISEYIDKTFKFDRFSDYFICYICEICMILFYIIEKYLSKSKKEGFNNYKKLINIIIKLIIFYLIFNII